MARNDRAPSTDIRVGAALCIFIAAVIAMILWKGFWWVDKHGTDNQYQIDRSSTQYQQGIVSRERDAIKAYDIDAKSLASNPDPAFQEATSAQQADVKSTFCSEYSTLTIVPADIGNAHARICG